MSKVKCFDIIKSQAMLTKDVLGMLKRFLSYYRPHIKLFVVDMICALLVAACNLLFPLITGNIISDYIPAMRLDLVVLWCSVLLFAYVLKAFLTYVIQYWGHMMGVYIQGDMRRDFFCHLQELPFTYFDNNKTGNIVSRIVNDLFEISELAHHGPEDLFLSGVTLVGALVIVAFINPWLALIVAAVVPFMCWFALVQRRRQKLAFKRMREETGEINADVESAISGIRVSKAYTASQREIDKFELTNKRYQVARGAAYKRMGIFNSGMGFFNDLLYLVALFAGGVFFYYQQIDAGQFTSYILCVTMITSPISTLTNIFEQIQNGMVGFARFCEVMDEPTEKDEPSAVAVDALNGDIEFCDVSFSYDNMQSQREVLSNVSFKVDKGQTVALVGPSGGGKTTMCHLIPRFYDVTSGKITIDGNDIANMRRVDLRRNVGIVQQDVFLFAGTIFENIAYGDFSATKEQVYEACKRANIHDYIVSLPDGYDTQVGERGVKLSGGQKQRISIARAFLKNPPILILDEATSALDNVTEMQIQHSLAELAKGRTTIVVAHRLSTVKNADKIVVVTAEGIAEQGTHQQLLDANGIYAQLYSNQFVVEQ